MKIAIFIDYDNLLNHHRTSGILDVARKALFQTPLSTQDPHGTCDIRIYGGWYEESNMTVRAQQLTVELLRDFPKLIRLPLRDNRTLMLQTTAALVVALLEEPRHHMFGTYKRKGKPKNIRVETPAKVGCTNPVCPLPMTKKLLDTGSCPHLQCAASHREHVYRPEQKIVDTMLACDMIYAPMQSYHQLILVSGDEDFLPPLRTVLLRGTPVARFHPQPNRTRTPLVIHGKQIVDQDL